MWKLNKVSVVDGVDFLNFPHKKLNDDIVDIVDDVIDVVDVVDVVVP